jgi:hypothetical protein
MIHYLAAASPLASNKPAARSAYVIFVRVYGCVIQYNPWLVSVRLTRDMV